MGWIIKPKRQPINQPFLSPVWYGITPSGKKLYMNALEAQRWARETGRPVFLKAKKYEL